MTYASAVDRLYALAAELADPHRKFRLDEMLRLCSALGDPQRSFPSVLIAGTNGKGSTSAMLASILSHAGYRVGLYTSPHLERVNERIRIEDRPIDDDAFATAFARVEETASTLVRSGALPMFPSFFEAITATAFVAFADAKIDIAILEVGLGGRLDATNVVDPVISIITDISLDHMEFLGSTVAAIAREKAGILRRDGVLVTLPQHPGANQAIGEVAMPLNVRGVNAAEYMPHIDATHTGMRNLYPLRVLGQSITVDSPLPGSHQQRNIALAIAAALELRNNHGYKLNAQNIEAGIRETRWPGRLERFSPPGRTDVLLDVAHNPAGVWALRSALSHLEPEPKSMTLVFSCLKDKALAEMAQVLFPVFDRVVLTTVASPRAASLESLRAAAAAVHIPASEASDSATALHLAFEQTPQDGLIVIAGSVYLVGELRSKVAAL